MSIPSITTITPSSGPTGGGLLVEVSGAGFQLPPPPPALGPTTPPPPTVRVLVGGRPAREVRVIATDRLTCLVPTGDAGTVDVVVQNLDATGAVNAGEQGLAPRAFTYVRPPLTTEADLTRLVRKLRQELKRQVLENVVLTVQTDFDTDTGDALHLAQVAQLPALVLLGPELTVFVVVHRTAKTRTGQSVVDIAALHEHGSRPIVLKLTPKARAFLHAAFARPASTDRTAVCRRPGSL